MVTEVGTGFWGFGACVGVSFSALKANDGLLYLHFGLGLGLGLGKDGVVNILLY